MPLSSTFQLPRLSTAGSVFIAALTGGAVGAAVASKPIVVVALIAILLAILGVVVALERPGPVFIGLVLLMALIPTYAAPEVGSLLLVPAAAAAWLIAAALAWRNSLVKGHIFRPTIVDYAAGAFALLMAISIAFSARAEPKEYIHLMFLWAGPYLAARLLLQDTKRPAFVVAASFALATVILAPVAILEVFGLSNPFHILKFNATEFSVWANQIERFGQVRAVTSFGHPIAFSMFVAVSALLSVAMGINSNQRNHRYAWYALAALAIGIQALALSRTGWLILAIGVVMIALVTVKGRTRRRLAVPLALIASVVLLVSLVAPNEVQILPGLEKSAERSYVNSGDYRQALLTRALEPGVLHLWGNPVNQVTPFVNGGTATDNAYIILADSWGLIPTVALILVALTLLLTMTPVYANDTGASMILPIVAFTCLAALFFVAFLTQQQLMVWLLVGAASVVAERMRCPVLGSTRSPA